MADSKITALTAISTVDPTADPLVIVDVSDTSMAASGTTKKSTINQLLGAGGTATLASATITGDLTVATDRLKVVTGSTAVQIGSTTQTQFGTTAWPSDLIAKANSRVLVGNLGTVLLWNESAAAIGNASNLFIGAKSGAGATTFGGSYISSGIENASDRAGFFALSTFQSNGVDRERYRIDSTGVHTWQYVGGVASTAMTLNSTGLNIANGNVILGTSGKGIDFSATASGSGTMTSELLNDYEEGTWVGTLTGSTANPTTPVTATGRYTKVGRLVTVSIHYESVNTTGASGNIGISGLPFANNASVPSIGPVSIYQAGTFTGSPFIRVDTAASVIEFFASVSGAVSSNVTHNAGTSRYISTSVSYTVA